jgi:hypothetical protein
LNAIKFSVSRSCDRVSRVLQRYLPTKRVRMGLVLRRAQSMKQHLSDTLRTTAHRRFKTIIRREQDRNGWRTVPFLESLVAYLFDSPLFRASFLPFSPQRPCSLLVRRQRPSSPTRLPHAQGNTLGAPSLAPFSGPFSGQFYCFISSTH